MFGSTIVSGEVKIIVVPRVFCTSSRVAFGEHELQLICRIHLLGAGALGRTHTVCVNGRGIR